MVIGALTLGVLAMAGYAAFRAARHQGRTIGLMAWRVGQATTIVFALAVVVYQKPASFYTNFVILPAALLYLTGLAGTLIALILGVTAIAKRDDVNRALSGLDLDGDRAPEPGAAVMAEDKEIGRVTSAVRSIALGRPIALGYIRREHFAPGSAVTVRDNLGSIAARVVALPFAA